LQLTKAEAKVEETYVVEERMPKTNKTKATTEANDTSEAANASSGEDTQPQTVKKTKKRTVPFPLYNIEKEYYGTPSLSTEQIKLCKERLRQYEKRDDDKAKTDKAKNDFETTIYALRDWVHEDENLPFVGSADAQDVILNILREAEDWLEDEGYSAKYADYAAKFAELNRIFT